MVQVFISVVNITYRDEDRRGSLNEKFTRSTQIDMCIMIGISYRELLYFL